MCLLNEELKSNVSSFCVSVTQELVVIVASLSFVFVCFTDLLFACLVQLKCSGLDTSAGTSSTCQLKPRGPVCP